MALRGIGSWILAIGNLVTMCAFKDVKKEGPHAAKGGANVLGAESGEKQLEEFPVEAVNNPFGSSQEQADLSDVSLYENYMNNSGDPTVGGNNPFDGKGNPQM